LPEESPAFVYPGQDGDGGTQGFESGGIYTKGVMVMDTSKEYIKMCDCPEIQGQWKPSEGDNFSFINEPKIIKDYEIWALEKRELSSIEEWNEIIKTMGNHFVDHFIEARDCFVWLPRQDQIQEMLQPIELHELLEVCMEPDGIMQIALHEYAESMEQLWLAFYMYEKHKKAWDGKKWVAG